ncbi:formyl peptide receptor-related sequence 4-like [Phyllostomus discolor]|uniref:Formyl peptide receptor-related sequence 4-like n=1 Tax=Phyllostomus discolor TaxID=89673 RepID=A0A7E6CPF0_9CHIR|nr:formyl peptide receptor-related sequence 4-like [Phyllostomus discolor]
MEGPSETRRPAPLGVLCPPGAALFLCYSLAALASYLLEVASHVLVIRVAGPCLPPMLSAAWFGHQAITDVAFMVLLPLVLTWTPSGWPLGGTFCHLDPGLAFLTFYASGRLLTRAAADCCCWALWPAWALSHRSARQVVLWAGGFWLLLLVLGVRALRAPRGWVAQGELPNGTSSQEPPPLSPDLALNQLVFGFGVPLGVLRAFHSLLKAKLCLARLTGRPPLLGLPWALGTMLFLCWFPFHLLLLVRLLGAREAGLGTEEVWVLLGPLGLTLVGASGCLNPLLYWCGHQSFRWWLLGPLVPPAQVEGLRRRQGRALGMETRPSCESLRESPEGLQRGGGGGLATCPSSGEWGTLM